MSTPVGRFNIAFDADVLVWDPVWTRIDDDDNLVTSWSVDRGRQYELDRTDGGRATVEIADKDGVLDPTNPFGPYWGKIQPLKQAVICRHDPVAGDWQQRFRGWISELSYDFDPSQQVNRLRVELTDMFEILEAIEMQPGKFGDPGAPTDAADQVWFDAELCDDRMRAALGGPGPPIFAAGIPDLFYEIFTGNVSVQATTFSPGESVLAVIQSAADGEFPGVSNVVCDRFGRLCFRGRYSKFDVAAVVSSSAYTAWSSATAYVASNRVNLGGQNYSCILGHTNHVPPNATYWVPVPPAWDWHHWRAGDGDAVAADLGNVAQIRRFGFNRGLSKIINSASATPMGTLTEAEITGQLVEDAGVGSSQEKYGIRSWSAQSLLTQEGLVDSSTALVETKRFATYYVDNYKQPQNRVTDIQFRAMRTTWPGSSKTWQLMSRCDIGDQVDITLASPGGGGFSEEPYYIEGIHETSEPGEPGLDNDTVTLDLSPKALFTTNPFPVP